MALTEVCDDAAQPLATSRQPSVCALLHSCQRAAVGTRRGEAGRFRRGGAAHRHSDQTQHFRRHALLDGPRGHQAVSL